MNDQKNKLKEAFELSDLLYFKRKEEIIEVMEEKLSEITSEAVNTNTTYRSQHIKYLLKERVKRIKEIVNKRLNLDLDYIEKVNIPFDDYIYQEIYKRVLKTIESEIGLARDKMLFFCRNSPYPKDILKIMNRRLDNEKNILIKNTKRDLQIHKNNKSLEIDGKSFSAELNDYHKHHTNESISKVKILGKIEGERNYFVQLNNEKIELTKSPFILFIRLIIARKESENGWVDVSDLEKEEAFYKRRIDSWIYRLREKFYSKFDRKIIKEFIQVDEGSSKYKLSIHPDLIVYQKDKLLKKDVFGYDYILEKLIERLP